MGQANTRRSVLRLLAGIPMLAVSGDPAYSAEPASIGRLIEAAKMLPRITQRIDFISHALLGVRYQAHTLIGGPHHRERFVVRDDAFDCVTFCEVVLAAAMARDLGEFEIALRRIRYAHGNVRWDQRNHYFAEWSRRNIENGVCQLVAIEPLLNIEKTVHWHRALGRRHVSIAAVGKATLLANAHLLSPGDVVGFPSRRPYLDFFHTGLLAFDADRTLLLRHASRSRGRVVEEKMATFLNVNAVRYVTLLRAVETENFVRAEGV
jgi:hypothetical protein